MSKQILISVVVLFSVSIVNAEVVIETVTVDNPGNAGYGLYSDGVVDYVYNIGKYEVTAGQYTQFLNAVAGDDTYGLYSTYMADPSGSAGCNIQRTGTSPDYSYFIADDWAARPVAFVSWGDAARYANWLHNGQPTGAQNLTTTEDGSYYLDGATNNEDLRAVTREDDATWVLPTEAEWFKAAYHKNDGVTGNYFDYPTSSDNIPSNELMDPDPGNNATGTTDLGYTLGSPYFRTEVGAHENSASPYGTFDQGGNVWEWNEAILPIRGGSFYVDNKSQVAWFLIGNNDPEFEVFDIGFRVAEVPKSKSDIDFDGDVDLDDYDLFQDVDLHDYALLQTVFTGPQ